MTKEVLLKVREQLKKKKPSYKRSQSNQFPKLNKGGWRKPKGMGNKLRRNRRGHRDTPRQGLSSPRLVRGLNSKGLLDVKVSNVSDLAKINAKEEAVLISSTVGARKTLEILQEAKKKSLSVSNYENIDEAIKAKTKEKKVVKKKTEVKADAKKETTEKKTEAKPAKAETKADSKTASKGVEK